jgi:hypothetical protein
MRTLLLALLTASALPAQEAAPVLLRWKVGDAPIAYKAALRNGSVDVDVEALAKEFRAVAEGFGAKGGKLDELPAAMKDFFKSFKLPEEFAMTMILAPTAPERTGFKLVQNKSPLPAGDGPLEKLLKEMEGTVQLRGEIDPSGAVTSWWLQTHQKNLVALLCQLPRDPVKPGDRWSIDVNFVTMGPGFVPSKAERANVVRLAGVRKEADGELVASLEYALSESVEGEFAVPGRPPTPTTLSMSFFGKAEFSVTRGAWKSYVGKLRTKGTGMMTTDASQDLALERLPQVPEELLKLR